MRQDILLKENIIHGTQETPINLLHFEIGKGKEYEDGLLVPSHWHDYVEFLLIRKGSYQVIVNLQESVVKEGDICIFNHGDLHQLTNLEEEACHEALLFDPKILSFQYEDQWNKEVIESWVVQNILSKNIIHPEDIAYDFLYRSLDQIFSIGYEKKRNWYARCKILILECLVWLQEGNFFQPAEKNMSEKENRQIARYKEVISYIEEHYGETITLSTLAKMIPCNEQYFCRFFKKISGNTPIQYLIQYRVQKACEMLRYSDRSISDIAVDCGFDNISYFIRKFRNIHGMTPKEYRQSRNFL